MEISKIAEIIGYGTMTVAALAALAILAVVLLALVIGFGSLIVKQLNRTYSLAVLRQHMRNIEAAKKAARESGK